LALVFAALQNIVLDILTEGQKGAFTKEDGEKVIDETGKRVK